MNKIVKRVLVGVSASPLLLGIASAVLAADGLTGDCYDCHTMHNSEQNSPVAQIRDATGVSISTEPIQNLLRFDCIACHAQDPTGGSKIWATTGGSDIPQVMHGDVTDLAGGNFRYISDSGNRKGHNVIDLVNAETDMTQPPGFRHTDGGNGANGYIFEADELTCAGKTGCHGFRNQLLGYLQDPPGCDPLFDCVVYEPILRTGMSALSGMEGATAVGGAHHDSYDGLKLDGASPGFSDSPLSHSYRFIRGLTGYGNETERWQNNTPQSHNEYLGGYQNTTFRDFDYYGDTSASACIKCHVDGTTPDEDSRLGVPNRTITGFCMTCHTLFHSSGATNGTSGAFLRHPSDWVIPAEGEYLAYTSYAITAPAARPLSAFIAGMEPEEDVTPGLDLVMCLSCHKSHASPYDYMLHFNYSAMTAGGYATITAATGEGGCLACHTTKGVLPENR